MNNFLWGLVTGGVVLVIVIYILENRYQKASYKEMAKCRAEHEQQLFKIEQKLKNSAYDNEKIKKDYEILLKDKESYRERFLETLEQKSKLQNHFNQFKKELYKARKRIKQHIGSKQK